MPAFVYPSKALGCDKGAMNKAWPAACECVRAAPTIMLFPRNLHEGTVVYVHTTLRGTISALALVCKLDESPHIQQSK